MVYQEIKPHKFLAQYIDSYWFYHNTDRATKKIPILPDCCMDIIYDLSNNKIFVCGVMTVAKTVVIKPADKLLGIRFMPGVLPALLGVSAMKLRNQDTPLHKIDKHLSEKIALLRCLNSPGEIIRYCNTIFVQEIRRVDDVTSLFSKIKIAENSQYSVKYLSQNMKMSVRHTERLFAYYIGLTPKHFLKIHRFQKLYNCLQDSPEDLATVSLECGYTDQSHMNKEYKQLTLVTPKRKKMAHFYKN